MDINKIEDAELDELVNDILMEVTSDITVRVNSVIGEYKKVAEIEFYDFEELKRQIKKIIRDAYEK